MTKSTEIFGLRAIGHHHVNARCHEFSGESGKRPTSPPTPNVRQISVWCDRPLMEWFGCAPAQPTTNAGRGHRRQNARHVTETRRASRKADYLLPTRRVDNSGAVRTSHWVQTRNCARRQFWSDFYPAADVSRFGRRPNRPNSNWSSTCAVHAWRYLMSNKLVTNLCLGA